MNRSRRAISLLVAGLLCAGAAAAEWLEAEILPDECVIRYTLPGNVHTVHGEFQMVEGELRFDTGSGAMEGRLVADASSGTAENPKVVDRMNKVILESDLYPEVVFRPDRFEGRLRSDATSHLTLYGVFTLHGTDHPIELPMEVNLREHEMRATAVFELPYVAWGLKDPSRLMFRSAKEVQLEMEIAARVFPLGRPTVAAER